MDPNNIFILETGDSLELTRREAKRGPNVQTGAVMVDGLGIGDVGNVVLRDRKHLPQDGILTVVLTIDTESMNILSGPDIVTRGFIYVKESGNLLQEATKVVRTEIDKCMEKKITDLYVIKSNIRYSLGQFLYTRTKRNPIILTVIMEI